MSERIKIIGIYQIAKIPDDWSLDDFRYWWCDEHDSDGRLIHPARMSAHEKERLYVAEFRNMILTAGVNQIANYLVATGTSPTIPQYFAIGNGAITKVLAGDTTLAGEFFRKVPTGFAQIGNQARVSTALLSTDATGQWTNFGIFSINATGTPNSGTLFSQAMTTFNKPSSAYTVDWLVSVISN